MSGGAFPNVGHTSAGSRHAFGRGRFDTRCWQNITSSMRRFLSYPDPRQVDQIKSPALSTPHRKDESHHSANRRDQAVPRSIDNTPPPNGMGRDDHQIYGDRGDKEVNGSVVGGRRVLQSSPRQPTCVPPNREGKQRGGEGGEHLLRHSGENAPSTPVVGGTKASRPTDGSQRQNGQSTEPVSAVVSNSSPAALHRCNSQQPRLLAAASAIEAAAAAVAAIPKVSSV